MNDERDVMEDEGQGAVPPAPPASPDPRGRSPRHRPLGQRIDVDREEVERGLASLVLTIVELLRQLMERQALRRVDQAISRMNRSSGSGPP